MEPQDTISIAPNVLIEVSQYAALSIDGVARMGTIPSQVSHLLRGHAMGPGVVLDIDENSVTVDIYLIVTPGAVMNDASLAVQQEITRSITELIGMDVKGVNIHIEDVDITPPTPEEK